MKQGEELLNYIADKDVRYRVLEALLAKPLTEKEVGKALNPNVANYKFVLQDLEDNKLVVNCVRVETKVRNRTSYKYTYDLNGRPTNYKTVKRQFNSTNTDHVYGLTEDGHRIYAEVYNMRHVAAKLWSGYTK